MTLSLTFYILAALSLPLYLPSNASEVKLPPDLRQQQQDVVMLWRAAQNFTELYFRDDHWNISTPTKLVFRYSEYGIRTPGVNSQAERDLVLSPSVQRCATCLNLDTDALNTCHTHLAEACKLRMGSARAAKPELHQLIYLSPAAEQGDGEVTLVPWSESGYTHACSSSWQHTVSTIVNKPAEASLSQYNIVDKVFLLPDTNTAYFQHFLDAGVKKIIQALPLLLADQSISIVMRDLKDTSIRLWLEELGISGHRILTLTPNMRTKLLFLSCKTPLFVHPVTLLGMRMALSIHDDAPCQERDTIFLVLRNQTQQQRNGGRRVLNIAEIEQGLRALAEELLPSLGFRLKIRLLDSRQLPGNLIKELRHARLLVGPHGGGMYNHLFAPTYASILEITSVERIRSRRGSALIFWRMADALGQDHYMIQTPQVGSQENLQPEVDKVLHLARVALTSQVCEEAERTNRSLH